MYKFGFFVHLDWFIRASSVELDPAMFKLITVLVHAAKDFENGIQSFRPCPRHVSAARQTNAAGSKVPSHMGSKLVQLVTDICTGLISSLMQNIYTSESVIFL
jgi:hypothetical protein